MNQLRRFILDEMEEIKRHKWLESEKAGCDLGAKAIMHWIEKHEKSFRAHWMRINCSCNLLKIPSGFSSDNSFTA